ncbi:hypothetical protein CYMTET_8014 [Cymbomonas tetramitiformis]|uniref:Uncharacterized protein n=1 Tax=Cymbomonas tetramitiformis TaxID=36881 RepID=A0AAE0GTW1_9CHLO|nr:hypothetical protein CYMTET_8014 [Cymbomonas tetramitiformis]
MGYSVANDCSRPNSGDSLCHPDCVTQEILKHCKSQTVALHVCTEKSMFVNVNGQHEGEPQRKDVHPDEYGGDDTPKSEQRLCAQLMAGATAQCWARRAAADPVPSRKGGIATFLLLLLHISSCLSTASRPLKVRTVLWPVLSPTATPACWVLSLGLGDLLLRCPLRGECRRSGLELGPV